MNIYKEAEQFIVTNPKKGSLQNRIFDAAKEKKIKSNPKQIYALVSSTLKYKPFILQIIKKSKLLTLEKKSKLTESMAILLVHDLLFSKGGRIQSKQHPLKEAVIRNKTRIQAELTKLKLKHGVQSLDSLIEEDDTPIRWFRANLIKTTKDQILREFSHLTEVDNINDIKQGTIYHDEYIPNLFGIHPKDKLTTTDAYLKGRVIIQDRASCFPAHILNPIPGVDKVIDSCSAPGNKTTHLASILKNTPNSIIAFEKDEKRSKILKMMCEKAGGLKCIKIHHADFTSTNPLDFPDITGFVVDPSCSGSGIFGRAFEENDTKDDEKDTDRLAKLASFQFTIVRHAMSFPNAKKLVYSTCSINVEENERVVIDLLKDPSIIKRGWRVCEKKDVIPTWPRRGFVEEFEAFEDPQKYADACVRSLPKVDGGIGFFAVAFERDC
ncbi:hypothetical protein CANARDRAFT_178305 [[Candida] arabinofermentans NRRL YB-2248]|uniref:SAM-dependent MTase RsmB/NOP-type domain-containing protein n=1 Tax=[Candida] arabinofermentans NRRL YB-2248 TaxID=983967 RepID=A0A1E4STB6_9ASCO|nr:hypothetical protein CANARDRAFT_178305 [[Candida] arabinofermentans NRRL YB-2248]